MPATVHRCPGCKTAHNGAEPASKAWRYFPFCSKRCQMLDLGKWLNGDYVISEPIDRDPPGSRPQAWDHAG